MLRRHTRLREHFCDQRETRTLTSFWTLAPKASVSTNSTIRPFVLCCETHPSIRSSSRPRTDTDITIQGILSPSRAPKFRHRAATFVVKERLELSRPFGHWLLRPACLPFHHSTICDPGRTRTDTDLTAH